MAEPAAGAAKKKFKDYAIGYFHVDFAEVRVSDGKLYLFVAIDRTSKLAFAELHPEATAARAADFWQRVVTAVPYRITKVLTDNGVQFTQLPHRRRAKPHLFDAVCAAHGIEHRCTRVAQPWTNGQVERMNRTLKEATVQRYHYQDADELNAPVAGLFTGLQRGQAPQKAPRPNALRIRLRRIRPKSGYLYTRPNP